MLLNRQQVLFAHAKKASRENRLARKLGVFCAQTQRFAGTRLKRAMLARAMTALALMPILCGLADPGSAPTLNLSTTNLTFGYVTVGMTSAARTVSLRNAGDVALAIRGVVITGSNATDFAQSNDCGSSVAVGAKCTFSVTMTPTGTGFRHASLTIVDNGPGGSQTVSLSGTGIAPTVYLSPSSLSFGSRSTGTTSPVQNITLSNSGPGILLITNLAITGADASDFAETNNCGNSVGPRRSCTIGVAFTPIASGTRVAAVVLTDNASRGSQAVSLLGVATGPASGPQGDNPPAGLSLSPTSLSFGNQPIAVSSAAQTITLTNNTGTALSIAGLTIGGANAGDFAEIADSCGASVAAGSTCTIGLSFTPAGAGERTATLSITDNASNSPQTVSLTGTGCPDIILSWAASTTPGIVGYNVYRGTASGRESATAINSAPVNATTYVDANVKAGTTYYYVLRSVAASGAQSPPSNETTAGVPAA